MPELFIDRDGFPFPYASWNTNRIEVVADLFAMIQTWREMPSSADDSLLSGIVADWMKDNWTVLEGMNLTQESRTALIRLARYMRLLQQVGGFTNVNLIPEDGLQKRLAAVEL
jgi:hypothetical protein